MATFPAVSRQRASSSCRSFCSRMSRWTSTRSRRFISSRVRTTASSPSPGRILSREPQYSQPVSTSPSGTFSGTGKVVYGRFRLFDSAPTFPTLAYAGTAGAGEVEDYRFLLDTGLVDGTVYRDTNGDGGYTPGTDTPLPGVTVVVTDSLGITYTLTTDISGYFSQTVPAGSTVVDVRDSTLPPGYVLAPGSTDPTTVRYAR